MKYGLYQCHKRVRAFKIKDIAVVETGFSLIPEESNSPHHQVDQMWYEKFQPQVGGYVVFYPDGYVSYSPALAFEEGYTLIGA